MFAFQPNSKTPKPLHLHILQAEIIADIAQQIHIHTADIVLVIIFSVKGALKPTINPAEIR